MQGHCEDENYGENWSEIKFTSALFLFYFSLTFQHKKEHPAVKKNLVTLVEKKSHYNKDDCVRVGGVTDVQGMAKRRHNKSGGLLPKRMDFMHMAARLGTY